MKTTSLPELERAFLAVIKGSPKTLTIEEVGKAFEQAMKDHLGGVAYVE